MVVFGLGLRPPLLFFYSKLLGPKIANLLLIITTTLVFIEAIFVIPILVPATNMPVPTHTFFKIGMGIESLLSLISVGLVMHSFVAPLFVWKQLCAVLFLLVPSIFRWWLHTFLHRLYFSCREPKASLKTASSGYQPIAMDSYDDPNEGGPLAAAYREMACPVTEGANCAGSNFESCPPSPHKIPPLPVSTRLPGETVPCKSLNNTSILLSRCRQTPAQAKTLRLSKLRQNCSSQLPFPTVQPDLPRFLLEPDALLNLQTSLVLHHHECHRDSIIVQSSLATIFWNMSSWYISSLPS